MKITHGGQTIDLNPDMPPVLNLSGGADSATLLFLMCTHFPELKKLDICTFKDTKKPIDYYSALDIIQWMQERFPNIELIHHVLEIDEADPYWVGKAQEMLDDPEQETVLTNPLGLSKLLQLHECQRKIYEMIPYKVTHLHAMTCNPPDEEMIEGGFYDLAERRRDKHVKKPITGASQPFIDVDKKFVSGVMQDYGIVDELLPLTSSCVGSFGMTEGFTEPCKICFWCHERYWAFGRY